MKKILPLLAFILFLSSCISVDDLGAYWDKGTIDPVLLGKWKLEPQFVKSDSDSHPVVIVRKDTVYQIDSTDEKELSRQDYRPVYARTLSAGNNLFLMVSDENGGHKGDLVKYTLTDTALAMYSLDAAAIRAFVKEKYPALANVRVSEGENGYLEVKTLTEDVVKMLSEIPDAKTYWILTGQYAKMKP